MSEATPDPSTLSSREIHLADEAATLALGRALGAHMAPGQGVALVGDLGAGKTCLSRGIGHGLKLDDPDAVCSPTYLLVVEHPGPIEMLHVDAYLPEKTRAFLLDGGLDYLAETRGVVVVEWADRLEDLLPERTLWVHLDHLSETAGGGRRATLRHRSPADFGWIDSI